MTVYEFIVFIILLVIFMGGFLYCLFKEVKSNSDLRNRLIKHLDFTDVLHEASVSCLIEFTENSKRT